MTRVNAVLTSLMLGSAAWGAEATADKGAWVNLFNGKDLSGWRQVGPGKWVVENGAIVGTQNDKGEPGDLMTRAHYKDFELEIEFKIVWPANSGIWFRKPSDDKWGYQFDILDFPDAKTGSVWSDGFKTKVPDEKSFKRDDWNAALIRCEGDHITVKLNGRLIGDFRDKTYPKGAIGFQTHAGAEFKNMKIAVRKARLRRLGEGAEQSWLSKPTNDYCEVCHVDMAGEEITTTHLKNEIACTKCHGDSVEHMQDEQGTTRADVKFGRAEVHKFCRTCHTDHKNPAEVEKFRAQWLGKTRPNGRPITQKSICTDCHGKHVVLKQTVRPGKAG